MSAFLCRELGDIYLQAPNTWGFFGSEHERKLVAKYLARDATYSLYCFGSWKLENMEYQQ
jgi:hypothetical protein